MASAEASRPGWKVNRHFFLLAAISGLALLLDPLQNGGFNYSRSLAGQREIYEQSNLISLHVGGPRPRTNNEPVVFDSLLRDTQLSNAGDSAIMTSPIVFSIPEAVTRNESIPHLFESKLNTTIKLAKFKRKVAFVHVGKAGGNTVRAAFPSLRCRKMAGFTRTDLALCFREHRREDSPLSQQCDLELHMGGERPLKELSQYTTFMFAIRNPVTRAISAYSYLHHNNTASPYAQSNHYLKEMFYKMCFPTLQHLLNTLRNSTHLPLSSSNKSHYYDEELDSFPEVTSPLMEPLYCPKMALAVLKGQRPWVNKINVHLRDNYRFYYKKTIEAFPHKEVLALRTEYLWNDIKELDVATGGTGLFAKAGAVANENLKTKNAGQDPTPEQLRDLCCVLSEDIAIYQEIVNRARNFPYHIKAQTMEEVWSTCGIDRMERDQYKLEGIAASSTVSTRVQTEKTILFSWATWSHDACPSI